MVFQKKKIISIDGNKITLPIDLIPKDVSAFSIEAMEDGRLILSPLPASRATLPPVTQSDDAQSKAQQIETSDQLAEVVDIRLGRKRSKKNEGEKRQATNAGNLEDDFNPEDGFVRLHHFPSRMEAEMIGEILKQAGLPFLIQSEDIGIFGPSAAPAPGGAGLVVRRTDLDYAKALLSGLI